MDVDASGARFTPGELDNLVRQLAAVARTTNDTRLAPIVAWLAIVAGEVAEHLAAQAQAPMMDTKQYAIVYGMSERTVRWRCQTERIRARKLNGRWMIDEKSSTCVPT